MKLRFTFLLTIVLAFWTSATQAGPGDGLGLFLDFGQLKPVNDASGREYQDLKVIGDQIDYQFALGNSFSFSLFASENMNKGTLPANTKYVYYKANGITKTHQSFEPLRVLLRTPSILCAFTAPRVTCNIWGFWVSGDFNRGDS